MTGFMRHIYRESRYLDSASEATLHSRFYGLLSAVFDLDYLGGVVYRPHKQLYASALVDVIDEMQLRQITYQDKAVRFSKTLLSRFDSQKALLIAQTLQQLKGRKCLFKFLHKEHAPALLSGSIRFTPASLYANEGLNTAVKDNELRIDHVLKGLRITTMEGERIPVVDDCISTQASGEYLISSFSVACDLRLFNLFEYDTCVVIANGTEFEIAVREKFQRLHCTDMLRFSVVEYLDPFRQLWGKQSIEFIKSIDFAFEREYRFVAYNLHQDISSHELRTISVSPCGLDFSLLEF